MVGYELTVFNLPQHVEGGIKIHGFTSHIMDVPKDAALLFHHINGMYGCCSIEGDKRDGVIWLHGTTPLIELENGEYQINGEAQPHEEDVLPEEGES